MPVPLSPGMSEHEPFFSFSIPPPNQPSPPDLSLSPVPSPPTLKPIHPPDSLSSRASLGFALFGPPHHQPTHSSPPGSASPSGLEGRLADPIQPSSSGLVSCSGSGSAPAPSFQEGGPVCERLHQAYHHHNPAGTLADSSRRPASLRTFPQPLGIHTDGLCSFSRPTRPHAASPSPARSSAPGSLVESGGSSGANANGNAAIGIHNTRPMTAPGAGWTAGQYNHGYDYSSASFGLFGDTDAHSRRRPLPDQLDSAGHGASPGLSPSITVSDEVPLASNTSAAPEGPHNPFQATSRKSSGDLPSSGLLAPAFSAQFNNPPDRASADPQGRAEPYTCQLPTINPHAFSPRRPPAIHSESPFGYSANRMQPPLACDTKRPSTHAGICSGFGQNSDSSRAPPTPMSNSPLSPYPPTLSSYRSGSKPLTTSLSTSSTPIYEDGFCDRRPSTHSETSRVPPFSGGSFYPGSGGSEPSHHTEHSRAGPCSTLVLAAQRPKLPTHLNQPLPYGYAYSHPGSFCQLDSTGRYLPLSSHLGGPRKRARRRYDEIERLYSCSYPGCTKAYGTLNHLNAHIIMQKHGPKRLPQEFKEIRKEWRARKKAEAEARSWPYKSQAAPSPMSHSQPNGHYPSQLYVDPSFKSAPSCATLDPSRYQVVSPPNPSLLGFSLSNTCNPQFQSQPGNHHLGPSTQTYSHGPLSLSAFEPLRKPLNAVAIPGSPPLNMLLDSQDPNSHSSLKHELGDSSATDSPFHGSAIETTLPSSMSNLISPIQRGPINPFDSQPHSSTGGGT